MAGRTARHGEELRTRFRPRNRIGALFLQVVPWLNVAIIVLMLHVVANRLVLAPGVVFELPRQPFREGVAGGARIVMLRVAAGAGPATLVFFDDVRYTMRPADVRELRAQLAAAARRPYGRELLLLADRAVPHGDVMEIVEAARGAGVRRVNVGVKPD